MNNTPTWRKRPLVPSPRSDFKIVEGSMPRGYFDSPPWCAPYRRVSHKIYKPQGRSEPQRFLF